MNAAWIFDFDGVLVNTMETHFACYSQALAEAGIPIDKAQFFSQAGMTGREQISWFARRRASAWTPTPSTGARERSSRNESRRPGRSTAWSSCCTCCARRDDAWPSQRAAPAIPSQPVIDQFDLAPDALVAAEDVQRGKPHPDLFLLAAERLGVTPQQCIVVEDSDVGIECARRAGMRALRFFDLVDRSP